MSKKKKLTTENVTAEEMLSENEMLSPGEKAELRVMRATQIVRKHMWLGMGAGLVPVPLVDLGLMSLIQLKMLANLSKYYKVRFIKNTGKYLITTLLGFVSGNSLRGSAVTGFLKTLPYVGILGSASMSIYGGASTYAIGKLFVQHFESGGTFLTLKPRKVRAHFEELFEEGHTLAKEMKKTDKASLAGEA
ncbi:MAG: DUF697 domain-containing protein [bacterium]|nr:DUF697 domain-containing protein [bacterium]